MSYWRGKGFKENIFDSDYNIISRPLWINACGEDYVEQMNADYIVDRPEGRSDYQMLYVKEGFGFFLLDGKTVKVGQNQIVIYRPGEHQQYRYPQSEKTVVYWIHFSGRDAAALLQKYRLTESLISLNSEFPAFESTVNKMLTELRNEFAEDICPAIFQTMLVKLANFISEQTKINSVAISQLERICDMMEQNISSNISVRDYAEKCELSEVHFIRIFKRHYGITPRQFIINKQIEKAMHLLESTNLPIKDIALSTGFANSYYFSKTFRLRTTVTPSEYRKQFAH